mmetsp:Transcript_103022/g.183022  ORF Transcript_103022/g.183022 Transcript_103022/m.183022 type:complete len:694 (-) Transcript_103022:22-2103(-)
MSDLPAVPSEHQALGGDLQEDEQQRLLQVLLFQSSSQASTLARLTQRLEEQGRDLQLQQLQLQQQQKQLDLLKEQGSRRNFENACQDPEDPLRFAGRKAFSCSPGAFGVPSPSAPVLLGRAFGNSEESLEMPCIAEESSQPSTQLTEQMKSWRHPSDCSDADCMDYTLQESVWDAAVLFGLPGNGLSKSDALIASFALVLNTILQLGFCVFVHVGFESEFSDKRAAQSELARWRTRYGHNLALAEEETGRSLVSMVCNFDKSVSSSARQSLLVDQLFKYLGHATQNSSPTSAPGFVLTLFALACWMLSIIAEVRCIIRFGLAVSTLNGKGSGLQRTMVLAFILASRLTVATLLFIHGSWFLSYTIELSDIILNAVALLFILEIDELLYKTLLTHQLHTALTSMKPLQVSKKASLSWHRLEGLTMLAMFCGCFVAVVCWAALPMFHNVRTVYDTLCGGDVDFVYSQDAVTLWPSFTTSPLFNDLTKYPPEILVANVSKLVAARTVVSHGKLPPQETEHRVFLSEGVLSTVQRWSGMSLKEWTSQQPCINDDVAMHDVVLLRASFDEQIGGCMDLVPDHCLLTPPKLFCSRFCFCESMSSFTAPESFKGTSEEYLLAHLNDADHARRQTRCCEQITDEELQKRCLTGLHSSESDIWFDELFQLAPRLRWWRTCSSGFSSCPRRCENGPEPELALW